MSVRKKITYSDRPNHAARAAHAKGDKQFRTYDTSHIRPKKSKGPLIVGIIIILAVASLLIWGFFTFLNNTDSPDLLADGETVEITISEGSGAREIGFLLQENRVIANSADFVNRVEELGVASDLKPGVYTLTGGMSLDTIIELFQQGPNANSFTVPEGYTVKQTAALVAEAYPDSITAEQFLACVNKASDYSEEFPFVEKAYNNSLEGFLFPKTYPLKENATADSVVRQMLAQYQTEVATIDYTYSSEKDLSAYDVLIIASMIEREASLAEERPVVSSVIYNRLDSDMKLQLDATVAYAKGEAEITPDDLKIDSPYNTYLVEGLPAGPICSPGISSLKAAAQPDDTDYLYYVATGKEDGAHYFAKTLEEHEANIEKSNNA